MHETATGNHRILRLAAVRDRTGLSTSTIYQYMTDGKFPRPIPLGGRSVGWVESEIQSWLAERLAARNAQAA